MKYSKNVLWKLILCIVLIEIILFASYFLTKNMPWLLMLIGLIMLMVFVLIRNVGNDFIQGLEGENDIGDELKKLPSDFKVFNEGLDTERGNIDKIVIGPTGVFAIEVKSHKAKVTFNGKELLNYFKPFEKDFLKQAYAEAMKLKESIKTKTGIDVFVQPILVFSSRYAKMRLGFNQIKGVYVIQKRWLNKLITQPNNSPLSLELRQKIAQVFTNPAV